MAILAMEGFDGYVDSADFRKASEGVVAIEAVSPILYLPTGGRYGGGAMSLNSGPATYHSIAFEPVAPGEKVYAGFWYKGTHSGGSTYNPLFQFYTQGTVNRLLRIDVNLDGRIRTLDNASAVNATAGVVLSSATWYWIEIEVTLGTNATTGAYDLRVNGSTVLSATGIDIHTGVSCGAIRFNGNDSQGTIDDVVVWDNQGTAPTGFIGESRISTYLPSADGAVQDWTASAGSAYQCIDDAPASIDGDTTYIEADGAGEKSRFALADILDTTTTIHAVALKARVRKTKIGVKTMRGYIRSNTSESNGSTIGLTDEYKVRTLGLFPRNPDGNIAWLDAAVNAMEAGVEVIS